MTHFHARCRVHLPEISFFHHICVHCLRHLFLFFLFTIQLDSNHTMKLSVL